MSTARHELRIQPGDFAIGTVTRLHESKGNSYLVDAARLVLDRTPNAKFFLVGEGPLREPLEAQARRLGLGDRFVFVGFARDVAAVLSAFDLSVFPSLWEGTPLTAFEALASGKPIVATDADGLLDILTDGRDARIVPKRDARALADAILDLIDRPDERAQAGGSRARDRPALRHHGLRAENGAVVRALVRRLARHEGRPQARAAAGGPVVSGMRVAVVTSAPLFVEGGHLVIARSLVQALREEGHEAAMVLTPQNRFGRQGAAYLATWFTDVGLGDSNRAVDQVISLRYPSYAVRHPNHVVWLNHTMREYYDQWDSFRATLSWKGRIKEGARRQLIHTADRYLLTRNVRKVYAQSRTISARLQRWGGITSEVLYPPPPQRAYRCDGYGDYIFAVSRLTPLKRLSLLIDALSMSGGCWHPLRHRRRRRRTRGARTRDRDERPFVARCIDWPD